MCLLADTQVGGTQYCLASCGGCSGCSQSPGVRKRLHCVSAWPCCWAGACRWGGRGVGCAAPHLDGEHAAPSCGGRAWFPHCARGRGLFSFFFVSSPEDRPCSRFREGGRREREQGEKHLCKGETSVSCLSYAPDRGLNPQPRHVP